MLKLENINNTVFITCKPIKGHAFMHNIISCSTFLYLINNIKLYI